ARSGLPRLACRRGRAGSRSGPSLPLRRDGLSAFVGACRWQVRRRGAPGGGPMSPSLLVKAARTGRTIARVTPQSAGWRYVGFEALRLGLREVYEDATAKTELCIVVVSGRVGVASGDLSWTGIGNRQSPFEDIAPYAVYLPPGRHVRI